jgi:hypothetical protein
MSTNQFSTCPISLLQDSDLLASCIPSHSGWLNRSRAPGRLSGASVGLHCVYSELDGGSQKLHGQQMDVVCDVSHPCFLHLWTGLTNAASRSLFMSSMAVLKVVNTPWLQATCTPQLFQTLGSAASWDSDWVRQSPSLHHMDKTLKSRLSATYETFEEGTAMAQSV